MEERKESNMILPYLRRTLVNLNVVFLSHHSTSWFKSVDFVQASRRQGSHSIMLPEEALCCD